MRLLTIHSAKGLEFPVVVVADCGAQSRARRPRRDPLPSRRARRLQDRRPGDGQAPRRVRVRRAAGGRARRRRGGDAAPLLRRHDAGYRPADRLGRRRPDLDARREGADPLDPRPPGGRPRRRRRAGRARARTGRGCFCASTGATTPEPEARSAPSPSSSSSPRSRARPPRGARAAAARADSGAAAFRRPASLVQRARALRALLLSLLRRADRRPALAGRGRRGARCRGSRGDARSATPSTSSSSTASKAAAPQSSCSPAIPRRPRRISSASTRLSTRGTPRRSRRSFAARVRSAAASCRFAFEHDGVLLHGRFDVFRLDEGRALVVDYKTNRLEDLTPDEVVEDDYALQRLVYALAAFRAGAEEVEVAYVFLERPDGRRPAHVRAGGGPGARGGALRGDRGDPGRATSGRRRASSPAPAARRSTSSAPGPTCPRAAQSLSSHVAVVPRNYVREARRRVGPKRERIRPVIERLAAAHPDAVIALRFRTMSSSSSR